MRALALVLFAALSSGSTRALAGSPPPPPAGWEQPPPLPAPPTKAPAPACCGYDTTCCERQRILDMPVSLAVPRAVEIRLSELPELAVKEAPKDHPGIPGVPAVHAIDGRGRPPPWPHGPELELRVMPPGRFGDIRWRGEWSEPFFRDSQYRSMGYGIVVHVSTRAGDTKSSMSELTGPVSFVAIDKGPGETITYDRVEGALHESTDVVATRWEHVEAAPVFDGYIHGFRDKLGEDQAVSFLLPEVILGFESKDAKHEGGFIPSRFSRTVAFTRYTLPVGPGRSALVTFDFLEHTGKRWFARPAGAEKVPDRRMLALVVSQTSAEAAPRARLLIFER
ncbi:Hypothetical protein A7982_10978 [Minicystis rosea]|nr:Hypothetical protein A7982_10978 [Minicystis rosea]